MRQRGRVAVANPIVLGGPVKPLVTVCQLSVALCAAFASGIFFIVWLLLAWTTTLCTGLDLQWPQKLILRVGKSQTFGIWPSFSVWAVCNVAWSLFFIWNNVTEEFYEWLALLLPLKSPIATTKWQNLVVSSMDNMSDFSDASSKQWFGDLSGFGMHSHCLAGATDRLNECQVIEDHAELPSDFSFEKLWLNLDKKQDVELPWEKGNWKSIFGSAQQFAIGSSQVFPDPILSLCLQCLTVTLKRLARDSELHRLQITGNRLSLQLMQFLGVNHKRQSWIRRWKGGMTLSYVSPWVLQSRINWLCWQKFQISCVCSGTYLQPNLHWPWLRGRTRCKGMSTSWTTKGCFFLVTRRRCINIFVQNDRQAVLRADCNQSLRPWGFLNMS